MQPLAVNSRYLHFYGNSSADQPQKNDGSRIICPFLLLAALVRGGGLSRLDRGRPRSGVALTAASTTFTTMAARKVLQLT